MTSHLTRRALQVTHANFARFRGGSDMLAEAWNLEEADFSVGYEIDRGGLATHDSSHVHFTAIRLTFKSMHIYTLLGLQSVRVTADA